MNAPLLALLLLALALTAHSAMPGASSAQCDTCTFIFEEVAELLPKNTTVKQIIAGWDDVCHLMGNSTSIGKECLSIGARLAAALPELSKLIYHDPYNPTVLCAIIEMCEVECCSGSSHPQQIHVGTGANVTSVHITWVSTLATQIPDPTVTIGTKSDLSDGMTISALETTYSRMGWRGRIFSAEINGLAPATKYYYVVGSPSHGIQSGTLSFSTAPADPTTSVTFGIIADMGAEEFSDETRTSMRAHMPAGIDMLLHNGDISYADGAQGLWDEYGRKMQPIIGYVPAFHVPGNHEIPFNFTAFRHRYPNPTWSPEGGNALMHMSVDVGPAHIVGVNTEGVLDTALVTDAQLQWLEADLQRANASRATRPWVVVMGHRPLYCSNSDRQNCELFATYLQDRLEQLYLDYRVDLVFEAHQHDYERSHPMARGKPVAGGVTYVLNGAAGNREGERSFPSPPPDWVATQSSLKGYGILQIDPDTLLYTQYASDDNHVVDSFKLTH